MSVIVLWGKDRFHFDLPPPDTTLATIRHSISAYTQLPYDQFTLVHDGAVMKDDHATISAYYIRPNSVIAIVTPTEPAPAVQNTEQAQIASIQSELRSVHDNLVPAHTRFLQQLNPQSRQDLTKEHSRLSELLLQALLRIDAIVPDRLWNTARAHRKAAVKELQALLDTLDSAWADTH